LDHDIHLVIDLKNGRSPDGTNCGLPSRIDADDDQPQIGKQGREAGARVCRGIGQFSSQPHTNQPEPVLCERNHLGTSLARVKATPQLGARNLGFSGEMIHQSGI